MADSEAEKDKKHDGKIGQKLIEEEMRESYLDYSMSVIVGRALPDVRDGLKPVHRRVLFTMHETGLASNKAFRKSANVVGNCLARYHPHGDTSVYDTLVRMAQDFSLRYPLVDGQGNWGSIDGDSAAAMRYCVTGDSLIVTEKGLTKIDNLSGKENINLKILSKDKKINKASKWFDSGMHPTLKLTTNKGYSLTGTHNHPVLTISTDDAGKPVFVWKLMENITEGDYVVIDRSSDNLWPQNKLNLLNYYPKPNKRNKVMILPKYLDTDLAFILGSFASEGSLTKHRIEFCNTDEKWIEAFQTSWRKVFPNTRLHKFKRKPSSYGKKDYYRLECHYRYVIEFLGNLGLKPLKSSYRQIPDTILRSPKEVVVAFLKAYFEGDGSISQSRSMTMTELSCCSKSEKLIDELQILLLRFGMDSSKRYDKHRFIWKLYIRGYRNVLRFYKELGFISDYKNKKLEYRIHTYKKDFSLYDFVPFISDYIRKNTHSEFVAKHNFDRYTNMKNNYEEISSIMLQKTGVDYTSLFEYFLTYNYLFDQVVQIKNAGIQKVFSLKVESDCHSFISNGFISHNTEARLTKIAEEMLEDIEKETVVFVPNFDNSTKEPSVLPSKLPNLLVNGSSGIAVGMATNIPPHNLSEVADATIMQIDNPEVEISQLMTKIKGPDFPTGAIIQGVSGIKNAYEKGQGLVKVRAKIDVEETQAGKKIIISEIPFQLNKSLLLEAIARLINDSVITGVSDLRDESDRDGMRIVIELKKDAHEEIVINQLYRHSSLESTFGIIMIALVDGQPKLLNLKELISHFITHRKEVVTKRTQFELKKAQERAHILEGLIKALDMIDKVVDWIKKSKDAVAAKAVLLKQLKLTGIQAQAILDMRLQRLASLEQKKIRDEHKVLLALIEKLKEILASEMKIKEIIKKELTEIKEKYGDKRRTQILVEEAKQIEVQELIKPEEMVVTITHKGYTKRLSPSLYRQQKRGGRGVTGAKARDDDFVEHIFVANTHSYILFFTNKGTVHWMRVYEVPEAGKQAIGKPIVNLLQLEEGESIEAFVPVKKFDSEHFIMMATKKGVVKKTNLNEFSNPRKGGIRAIFIDKDDELVNATITDGKRKVVLATRNGMAIKFDERDARPIGRAARGVKGINLKQGDEVIGMVVTDDDKILLTITEKGYGKKTLVKDYRQINRGGSGVINMKVTEKNGKAVSVKSVEDTDELVLISKHGIVIKVQAKGISTIGRATQGVRVMRLEPKDQVIAAARIHKENNDKSN